MAPSRKASRSAKKAEAKKHHGIETVGTPGEAMTVETDNEMEFEKQPVATGDEKRRDRAGPGVETAQAAKKWAGVDGINEHEAAAAGALLDRAQTPVPDAVDEPKAAAPKLELKTQLERDREAARLRRERSRSRSRSRSRAYHVPDPPMSRSHAPNVARVYPTDPNAYAPPLAVGSRWGTTARYQAAGAGRVIAPGETRSGFQKGQDWQARQVESNLARVEKEKQEMLAKIEEVKAKAAAKAVTKDMAQ
ncbi:hypothetical protein MMC11_000171 [Xylographa trunciseda]|nr:hypothetical protein [Xylographa trunciseda]